MSAVCVSIYVHMCKSLRYEKIALYVSFDAYGFGVVCCYMSRSSVFYYDLSSYGLVADLQ